MRVQFLAGLGPLVRDPAASLRFYRDILGLTVTADAVMMEQGVRGVLLACGENEIEIIQPVVPDNGVARFLALDHPLERDLTLLGRDRPLDLDDPANVIRWIRYRHR